MNDHENELHDLRDQRECRNCGCYRDEHDLEGECQVDECPCPAFTR